MSDASLFFLFAWHGYLEGLCFDHYHGAFASLDEAKAALTPLDADGDWNAQVVGLRGTALVCLAVYGFEGRGQWLDVPLFTPLIAVLRKGAVIERVDMHSYGAWGKDTLLYLKHNARVDVLSAEHLLYPLCHYADIDNQLEWYRLSTEGRDGRTVSRLRLVRQHPAPPAIAEDNPYARDWQESQRTHLNTLVTTEDTE